MAQQFWSPTLQAGGFRRDRRPVRRDTSRAGRAPRRHRNIARPSERIGQLLARALPPEPTADDVEPIPTSPRPRQVPAVDELGWELGQATKWRDGLPQMAHTLAKAASTGQALSTMKSSSFISISQRFVTGCWTHTPTMWTGRGCKLAIAGVDRGMASADSIGANYHFAWFQALNYVP